MSDSIINCIVMRYGSSRLPGKVLVDLGGGVNSIDLLLRQLRHSMFPTVICCPEGWQGDPIAEYLAGCDDCECFRGPLENVLQRMVLAADAFEATSFVRITGDDLFIDPWRSDRLAAAHRDADFSFTNLPKGTETVVVNTQFAKRLLTETAERDTELWDKQRGEAWGRAKLNYVPLSPVAANEATFAVELDTPDDADVIRETLRRLESGGNKPPFSVEDLAALHAQRPFPKTKDPVDRRYFDPHRAANLRFPQGGKSYRRAA